MIQRYNNTNTRTYERGIDMEAVQIIDNRPALRPVTDFTNLYERFIAYIDASPQTIATYSRNLKQFFRYLQAEGIKQPTRTHILAYRTYLEEQGLKATTIQAYIVVVRLFFKWTATEGIYPNIADNVKSPKLSKDHKKDYLTAEQIRAILSKVDTSTEKGKRDYAIIALMVTGGLRTIEVSRANIEDLGIRGNSTVLYIQGKGRTEKAEYVKISPETEGFIREYLQAREDTAGSAPLFSSTSNNSKGGTMTTRSISKVVKNAFKKAGYNSDRLTAHSLRHTSATLNLLNGGTLEETKQLLRHDNITTTMIYNHALERADNNSENRISSAIFS